MSTKHAFWRTRLAGAAVTMLFAAGAGAEITITVNGYGGAPWEAIDTYIHAPYTKETGVKIVNTTQPNLSQLKAMVESGAMEYEVLELDTPQYLTASRNGWIEEIDYRLADPDNKQPMKAKKKNGMVFATYSTILVYRTDKMPAGKTPKSWADFWDVETFPGGRAVQNSVATNLEFALMADGVPKEQVYAMLETQAGVDRAFKKLDQLKPHVVKWWKAGAEPIQLLADGEVVMAQAWNGRAYNLTKTVPVGVSFNQATLHEAILAIPKGNKLAKEAMKYFTAYSHPERIAKFCEVTPYPGYLPGVAEYLPAELAAFVPTYPPNLEVQLVSNDAYWDKVRDELTERWNAWLLE
jgi:putative spermidine/putrescine transport system substrate-binding protein